MRTVKQCPPFVDAMAHGFIIPLPCDVMSGRRTVVGLGPPAADGRSPSPLPGELSCSRAVDGHAVLVTEDAIVKFNSFWTIELEPGYSLFATHPVNREDLPFRLLTGLVDSDRFSEVGILFPAEWLGSRL